MPFTVSDAEKQELATVFAALALYDDKIEITGDNLSKLIKAAKGKCCLIRESYLRKKSNLI